MLSSPEDQLQPKTVSLLDAKPGDVLDRQVPAVFDLPAARQVNVDESPFPNQYDVSELVWRKDGRHLTFEYNQRGHQPYRIIEIDAETGATRAVVSEEPKTSDPSVIADLEHADASALLATGWTYPEVFHAEGRDGKTDTSTSCTFRVPTTATGERTGCTSGTISSWRTCWA